MLLNPDDEAIQTNLSFAQKMAIDDIKILPEVGFKKMVKEFTSTFHYDTWAWIAVGFSSLFLLFFEQANVRVIDLVMCPAEMCFFVFMNCCSIVVP